MKLLPGLFNFSKRRLLMIFQINKAVGPIIALIIVVQMPISYGICNAGELPFKLERGLIIINQNQISLLDLLAQIADQAKLQIYLITPLDPATRVSPNYEKVTPETLINSLLKGYSYALVYNSKQAPIRLADRRFTGSKIHYQTPFAGRRSGDIGSLQAGHQDAAAETREAQILSQIEELENKIDSGASDQEYERWIKVRGPRYVTHDRDRLAAYRKQLQAMRSN